MKTRRMIPLGSALPMVALVSCTFLSSPPQCPQPPDNAGTVGSAGYALRFCGTGLDDIDRVKVLVDDPRTDEPGPPVDVGATDFTLEWWMKAELQENDAPEIECGENISWINGNIVFDRDRYGQGRKYGVSLGAGRVVFGVSNADGGNRTICGTSNVADGAWHHVAVQRRLTDGHLSLYVDGRLESDAAGPLGDVSYPDDGVPENHCGGICLDSDPYLVLGAEKHDAGRVFPSYSGWLDEVRISTELRYDSSFTPPAEPFEPDTATAALWHFDEGSGHVMLDSSPHAAHGLIHFGGPHGAPRWVASDAPLR